MSDWEQRMADRAAARALARYEQEQKERAEQEVEEERLWEEKYGKTVREQTEAYVSKYAAYYTLEDAITEPVIACACIGPPMRDAPPGFPCNCALSDMARDKVMATAGFSTQWTPDHYHKIIKNNSKKYICEYAELRDTGDNLIQRWDAVNGDLTVDAVPNNFVGTLVFWGREKKSGPLKVIWKITWKGYYAEGS